MNQEAAAPALREALEKINEWVCYASEEDVNAKPMAMQQIGVIARAALAARPADPVEPTSVEQSALIDEELAKRGWPANMKNASRAGWAACLRYLADPVEPLTQTFNLCIDNAITAGTLLSNVAFNVKQQDYLAAGLRKDLERCQREWDVACGNLIRARALATPAEPSSRER